ncbi:MAG: DUF4156 domain-containing protein, partial [Kangiellaceae bacterium]|nr:DUF4156 domain-containing protein [Kangiellaceae bacterium]
LGLAVLSLTACQSIKLTPGAEQIRIALTKPSEQCEYLGDITGNQGDFFTGEFTSNENLETGARHDLKNKALKLGGNTVVLLTQRAGQTASFDPEFGGGSSQTNVTLSGNVYRCSRIAVK